MANEQPDDVGFKYEPQNGNQAAADSQPRLNIQLFDQRIPVTRSELSNAIQENQQCYGQATICFPSIPQTDGDVTLHQGIPDLFPTDNRCTGSLPGIGQSRPFGHVKVDQDDLPVMSIEGVSYPPGIVTTTTSHQENLFHRGMEVEVAGEASQDQSINSTVMQTVTGEQTLLRLPEGDRQRQLSDSDVSMESEENTTNNFTPQDNPALAKSQTTELQSDISLGDKASDKESPYILSSSEPDRENSFRNAPNIFYRNPQLHPKHMAGNGFCYTGERDTVRCFMCHTVLHTWDPHDNPLIEHIRHGPEDICPYLRSTADQNILDDISEQLKQHNNGKLSHDIDETAVKPQMSRDQMQLRQQQMLVSTQEMSAASGNTAVFQSSNGMKQKELRNADEDFLCQDCRMNKVNHTQRDCGHGICGECIRCKKGTPMTERKCVTCNKPVIGYSPWAPNYSTSEFF